MLPIYLDSKPSNATVSTPDAVLSTEKRHLPLQLIHRSTTKRPSSPTGGTKSTSKWTEDFQPLAADFTPGAHDVICGRGRAVWNHAGNKAVRNLVKQSTSVYANAKNRAERSAVVSEIVDSIKSKGTGFVKNEGSKWVEVGDLLAREKVGQMLRNALSTKYRSSVASKQRRRRDAQAARMQPLHQVMQSNKNVKQSVDTMTKSVSAGLTENELMALFAQEQSKLLDHIKRDNNGLVDQFLQAEVSACLIMDDDSSSSSTDSDGDVEMQFI